MKKATLIIAALSLLATGVLFAEDGLGGTESTNSVGAAQAPKSPPLLLAQALPGMQVNPGMNPVNRLPGMSNPATVAPVAALPQPLISRLTNYPNPFDSRKSGLEGQTIISYELAQDAQVSMDMYDLLGHKVRIWDFAPGTSGGRQGVNTIYWDGTNAAGQKVSKGGYIAQIVIETSQTTVTVIRKIGVIH